MRFRHGLVVGKFYPPHAGHHFIIDHAAGRCARVTVLVAASTVESIPLALRTAWLREAHPQPNVDVVPAVDDVPIDYDSEEIWAAHVEIFQTELARHRGTPSGPSEAGDPDDGPDGGDPGGGPGGGRDGGRGGGPGGDPGGGPGDGVDAVFSSEPYGAELARRMSATHVPVDPPRARFPVSGTVVRRDPVAGWRWLSPPVRAHLARRVAVVGAESSGTTTLARALAEHYAARGGPWASTRWVPEYGRVYCAEKLAVARQDDPSLWIGDLSWDSSEFTVIAERHHAMEEAAARAGSPLLVCDTDALATSLWHERYVGGRSADAERRHRRTPHDLWILTDIDGVPFHQDGWRDGEQVRAWMTRRFRTELRRRNLPHLVVTGSHADRLAAAVEAVDALLDRGWSFAEPLGPPGR